jgi:hypothetical protein
MRRTRELVDRIRARFDAGALPTTRPHANYASYGGRLACDGCGETIRLAQVQHEMSYDNDRIVRLHLGCAGVWEAECRLRGHR